MIRALALQPDDVLLGRGSSINEYVGNQRFRDLVDERKAEYKSHSQFDPKQRIAQSILDRIHERGGRFLRLARQENEQFVFEESVWEVCDEPSALEKIKQGLRQKNREPSKRAEARKRALQNGCPVPFSGSTSNMPTAASSAGLAVSESVVPSSQLYYQAVPAPAFSAGATNMPMFTPTLPPSFSVTSATSFMGPATGSLFQSATFTLHPSQLQQSIFQNSSSVVTSLNARLATAGIAPDSILSLNPPAQVMPAHASTLPGSTGQDSQQVGSVALRSQEMEMCGGDCGMAKDYTSVSVQEDQSGINSDKEASEYLLSMLALSDRTVFTEQDCAIETATLTDEDKAEALSDLFGRRCSVDSHMSKKPKRDLDKESITFLVRQMRVEIEAVPSTKKLALLEAQEKCAAEEFSDARLEKFLRCEGMNTKLAAKRFINYWQARLEVFGKERFVQRMTLSEALRDDIKAIETGFFCILPSVDESGRPIVYANPSLHTREGYSSESLLRYIWYGLEVVAQGNTDVHNSHVEVIWNRDSTMFDYDKIYERVTRYRDSAFPVKTASLHVCCSPKYVTAVVKPVLWAFKNKASRARSLFHSASESEIMSVLATYGVRSSMLPSEMPGGSLVYDHKEWIAQRRAIEMEEIA